MKSAAIIFFLFLGAAAALLFIARNLAPATPPAAAAQQSSASSAADLDAYKRGTEHAMRCFDLKSSALPLLMEIRNDDREIFVNRKWYALPFADKERIAKAFAVCSPQSKVVIRDGFTGREIASATPAAFIAP